jgi:hypothetical protein
MYVCAGRLTFLQLIIVRTGMLTINGKPLPNAREANPPLKFNMSFANSPSVPSTEYNLFVNNIPQELDDAALFLVRFWRTLVVLIG